MEWAEIRVTIKGRWNVLSLIFTSAACFPCFKVDIVSVRDFLL